MLHEELPQYKSLFIVGCVTEIETSTSVLYELARSETIRSDTITNREEADSRGPRRLKNFLHGELSPTPPSYSIYYSRGQPSSLVARLFRVDACKKTRESGKFIMYMTQRLE